MSTRRGSSRGGQARSGRPNDAFGDRAKADGYPARSVYKLEEIDRRLKILRAGQSVLDLGAAPGSWALYAARKVGPKGRVVAIDPHSIDVAHPQLTALRGTIEDTDLSPFGMFDVVLSDMAPATMGDRGTDQARSFVLFSLAAKTAARVTKPRGAFVGKIFQGPDFEDARKSLRADFEEVKVMKPEASRSESYEIFLVGLGRRS